MKLNVHRETVIGLSVLLALLVTLGVVAARRFMRPSAPAELIAAAGDAKHEEQSLEHRLKREADRSPKADLLTPIAAPGHPLAGLDSLRTLDDPGHWNTAEKEKRKEGPAIGPALGPIVSDPPTTSGRPEKGEPHHREGERTSTYAPPELPPDSSVDRYAAVMNESSPAHPEKVRSRSMVVQVGNGESAEGAPRPLDRYASESRDRLVQPGPGPAANEAAPSSTFDGSASGMTGEREEARHRAEKSREHEFQMTGPPVDGSASGMTAEREDARRRAEKAREHEFQVPSPPVDDAPRRTYADERLRAGPASPDYADPTSRPPAGYAPNYAAIAARDNAASRYSTAPDGYAPDNSPRYGESPRFGEEAHGPMPGQSPLRGDGTYEVQPNDSYWTVSERVYGSGAYFRALAEQNRGKAARPDRLPPGLVISTPPVGQLEKDYPDLCPRPNRRETVRNRGAGASLAGTAGGGRTYIVQEGDTLSSIARNELGKVSRWADIYQLNREALGRDYDYLTPGLRLVLPIREAPWGDRTTRRSDGDGPSMH